MTACGMSAASESNIFNFQHRLTLNISLSKILGMKTLENRKYFRFPCQCFGEVRFGTREVQLSLVKNVSSEGMGLVVHGIQCCPDTNVEVRLDLPEQNQPLLVEAEVKWSSPINHHVEVGLQFNQIDSATKQALLDFGFNTWFDEVRYQDKGANSSFHN